MLHEKAKKEPYKLPTQQHGYICHTACIYWALQAKYGNTDKKIAELTEKAAAKLCPKCLNLSKTQKTTNDNHDTLASVYGSLFMKNEKERRLALAKSYDPNTLALGDVILFGDLRNPTHSVVCAQKDGTVWVRGYNNFMTFGHLVPKPEHNRFDPHLRDLAQRNFKETQLFQVSSKDYIEVIVKLIGLK
jgi:hypothetical protein